MTAIQSPAHLPPHAMNDIRIACGSSRDIGPSHGVPPRSRPQARSECCSSTPTLNSLTSHSVTPRTTRARCVALAAFPHPVSNSAGGCRQRVHVPFPDVPCTGPYPGHALLVSHVLSSCSWISLSLECWRRAFAGRSFDFAAHP